MKKLSLFFSLVLAAAMLLTSCGGQAGDKGSAENASQTTAQKADKQVELEVAFWGDKAEIEMKKALLDEFQKKNPNIRLKATYTDGGTYQTKIQTWFSSNTAPDVLGMASDLIFPYKNLGVIEDLTPYATKDNMLGGDVWEASAIKAFTFDNKLLAAPYVYKSLAIAYNKKLFDEAKIAYPTADWTEEQMLDMARKLTKGSGPNKQWGIRMSTFPTNFYRNMFGEPVYNTSEYKMKAAGNEKFRYSFELLSSMVKEGITPNETFESGIGFGFESGKFAMAITAPWDMSTFDKLIGDKFGWDVQVLPRNTRFNMSWQGYLFCDGFAMSSKSADKDQAWTVVKYLTSDYDAQKTSAAAGVPMLSKYANSDEYLNGYTTQNHYNKKVFVDMLKNSVSGETTGVWAQINDVLNAQFQLVVTEKSDVDKAISEIQAKGEQILEQSKK